MLPINLRITLIIAVGCYFFLILLFLKKKSLELKYTLLWLLAGLVVSTVHWIYIDYSNGAYIHCFKTDNEN